MSRCDVHYIYTGADTQKCVICEATPEVQAVPTRFIVEDAYGWNSNAYSKYTRYRDCQVRFSMFYSVGIILGLSNITNCIAAIQEISHGFYFCSIGGAYKRAIIEAGVLVTALTAQATEDTVYTIERVNGVVRYYAGSTLLYTSGKSSKNGVNVHTWLYAPTDRIA